MPEKTKPQLDEAIVYHLDPSAPGNTIFAESDYGLFGVRKLEPGTTTELATREADFFCFVKKGKGRILGSASEVMAELGEHDGIVVPAGTPYAIEASTDSPVPFEMLEFHAATGPLKSTYLPLSE